MEDNTAIVFEEITEITDIPSNDAGLKRKLKKTIPKGMEASEFLATWTQCHYYVKGKNRYCNVAKAPNSLYCGTHRPAEEGPSLKAARFNKSEGPFERCPCPVDPTHTIYRHNLEHHIKICNIATRNALLAQQPYYRENCNSGSTGLDATDDGPVDVEALYEKIRRCYADIFDTTSFSDESFDFHVPKESIIESCVLNAVARDQTSEDKLRHCKQDVYLVKQMIAHDLLAIDESLGNSAPDASEASLHQDQQQLAENTAYVELGAGKGMLGLAVQSVTPRSTIVLVERSGMRRKGDKIIRDSAGRSYRARMDIRHCFLPTLPGVCNSMVFDDNIDGNGTCGVVSSSIETESSGDIVISPATTKNVVVVAKHLCGVATDLAIRSFEAFRRTSGAVSGPELLDQFARGLAIATCCHHACVWNDYVGKDWLHGLGFTSSEFNIMKLWSGWAHTLRTCAGRRRTEGNKEEGADRVLTETDQPQQISDDPQHTMNEADFSKLKSVVRPSTIGYEEMSIVGKMTKRLIDEGRVRFLRSQYGFTANQLQFCSPVLSPECIAIVANRRKV